MEKVTSKKVQKSYDISQAQKQAPKVGMPLPPKAMRTQKGQSEFTLIPEYIDSEKRQVDQFNENYRDSPLMTYGWG